MAKDPCNTSSGCPEGDKECFKWCIVDGNEPDHLQEALPVDLTPTEPVADDHHRTILVRQCNDGDCGQRIQFITAKGHEIRMMDDPSEANNISITTSDAKQHMRFDEFNKMTFIDSDKHCHFFVNDGHATANLGMKSTDVKYLDPNAAPPPHDKLDSSTYQLLQTNKKHRFWMADTPECMRIHAYTVKGHELLLLDNDTHDYSTSTEEGKIQITTYDKLMQIVMDVHTGDILINNLNTKGKGGHTTNNNEITGSIKLYSVGDIEIHAEKSIGLYSNENITLGAPDGDITIQDSSTVVAKLPAGPGVPPVPLEIKPSVFFDLVIDDGRSS